MNYKLTSLLDMLYPKTSEPGGFTGMMNVWSAILRNCQR